MSSWLDDWYLETEREWEREMRRIQWREDTEKIKVKMRKDREEREARVEIILPIKETKDEEKVKDKDKDKEKHPGQPLVKQPLASFSSERQPLVSSSSSSERQWVPIEQWPAPNPCDNDPLMELLLS